MINSTNKKLLDACCPALKTAKMGSELDIIQRKIVSSQLLTTTTSDAVIHTVFTSPGYYKINKIYASAQVLPAYSVSYLLTVNNRNSAAAANRNPLSAAFSMMAANMTAKVGKLVPLSTSDAVLYMVPGDQLVVTWTASGTESAKGVSMDCTIELLPVIPRA